MPGQEGSPQVGSTEPQASQPLVEGPRQVGDYPLPSGAVVSHQVTGDGMKQTVVQGSPYRSAAEFHAALGVATDGELQKVADARAREEALSHAPVINPQQKS